MTYATAMMYISDAAERPLGFAATKKDQEELDRYIPKIRFVDGEGDVVRGMRGEGD